MAAWLSGSEFSSIHPSLCNEMICELSTLYRDSNKIYIILIEQSCKSMGMLIALLEYFPNEIIM